MNILHTYLRSKLDLSNIDFQRGSKEGGYFCTPLHSRVIGWTGVDGIHFCTIKGLHEIIFAVNPTYEPGDYVHPVARNFEDFLERNKPTEEMQVCLDSIRKKYKLMPMEDLFAYMHQLEQEFDYDSLVYPPEYYELVDDMPKCPAPE